MPPDVFARETFLRLRGSSNRKSSRSVKSRYRDCCDRASKSSRMHHFINDPSCIKTISRSFYHLISWNNLRQRAKNLNFTLIHFISGLIMPHDRQLALMHSLEKWYFSLFLKAAARLVVNAKRQCLARQWHRFRKKKINVDPASLSKLIYVETEISSWDEL